MQDSLSVPIVRVALEAVDPSQTQELLKGLVLLNQADPCVQVILQETGENVIVCAGELHLERCVNDLKTKFANIPIHVSPPIVPFRETITNSLALSSYKLESNSLKLESKSESKSEKGMIYLTNPSNSCQIQLQCLPMPSHILKLLIDKDQGIKNTKLDSFYKELLDLWDLQEISLDKLWSFGPKETSPNMLFYNLPNSRCLWRPSLDLPLKSNEFPLNESLNSTNESLKTQKEDWSIFEKSVLNGFQLATQAGPLCNEPMAGVIYILHDLQIQPGMESDPIQSASLSGQIISLVKEGCLKGFLNWSSRLMLAYYTCEIQAPSEVLGKVYGVLSKRRGKILSEEMRQGTCIFVIQSTLPVIESFGFADGLFF